MFTTLSDLITDWGGFEDLVKSLHETGSVEVFRNRTLIGKSGASRQIDILLVHRSGLYEHKIVVECKYWNKNVSRMHVDALATTVREVGASKGVIFSVRGFQKGAVQQAKHEGISLFKLRELTDDEWGKPGRVVDFWMHVISIAFGNLNFDASTFAGYEPKGKLEFSLVPGKRSFTPIALANEKYHSLEDFIENIVRSAAQKLYRPQIYRIPDDLTVDYVQAFYRQDNVVRSKRGIIVLAKGGLLIINSFHLELGVDVLQSRFTYDRADGSMYALAVEDCVSKSVHSVQRLEGSEVTTMAAVIPKVNVDPVDPPLANGSILQIWTTGYQDIADFADVKFGEVRVATPREHRPRAQGDKTLPIRVTSSNLPERLDATNETTHSQ